MHFLYCQGSLVRAHSSDPQDLGRWADFDSGGSGFVVNILRQLP
jgi:hypothetical protein